MGLGCSIMQPENVVQAGVLPPSRVMLATGIHQGALGIVPLPLQGRGPDTSNGACKPVTVRSSGGGGGVSRGHHTAQVYLHAPCAD